MNIICTQENLQRYLGFLDKVIVKQTNLPILSNILFQTENGRVKLSATNLEIGITCYVGAKVTEEGSLALPARIMGNFVNNLPSGEVVQIQSDDQKVQLLSGNYTLSVFSAPGKDFPLIPRNSFEHSLSLPALDIKNSLQKILYAASTNTIRPELTGVLFSVKEGVLHMVATDSFRLVEEKITLPESGYNFDDIIIPKDTLQELTRVIQPESTHIRLAVEENQIFFEVDGVEITSRLINGKFPDYTQVIPTEFSDVIQFQKSDFQRALKIAAGLSGYTGGEVALVCDKEKNEVSLISRSHDVGENVSKFPFENVEGHKNITFLFHVRFLQEYLTSIAEEIIIFSYNSEYAPVLFQAPETVNQSLSLVMPIRK